MKRFLKFGLFSIGLFFLSGCDNANRSMVFFTGTTLGVEIAFEPNATAPGKFIIGYKRVEGLLDPVMEDAGTNADGSKKFTIKDKSHSVLAKIAGEIKSGTGAANPSLQGAQWFASGDAAEILARHPATAAVLTNDTGIAASVAQIAILGKSLQSNTVARGFLSKMSDGLEELALPKPNGANDPIAQKHLAGLNALAPRLLRPERIGLARRYSFNPLNPNVLEIDNRPSSLPSPASFQDVPRLSSEWDDSVKALQITASMLTATNLQLDVVGSAALRPPTIAERAQAVVDLATYPQIASSFNTEIRQSIEVVEAAKYYTSLFLEN